MLMLPLSCGFPKITHELEWLPHLFVAGGLADLELGPFARNIMGGKEAVQRIYSVFQRINHHREYHKYKILARR